MPRKTPAKLAKTKSRSDYIAARKVYVVMANDFPDAVFRRERPAKDYAMKMNQDNRDAIASAIASGKSISGIRIYHHKVYEMELR